MAKTQPVAASPRNRLLARLPAGEYERLFADLRPVPLEFKDVLYEPEALIDFVYFPNSGVVSHVTVMENGAAIELSTVGNEGMVGLPISLGIAESSSKAVVQVPGSGLRMAANKLKPEMSRDTPLRAVGPSLHRRVSVPGFPSRGLQRTALGPGAVLSLAAHDPRTSGR